MEAAPFVEAERLFPFWAFQVLLGSEVSRVVSFLSSICHVLYKQLVAQQTFRWFKIHLTPRRNQVRFYTQHQEWVFCSWRTLANGLCLGLPLNSGCSSGFYYAAPVLAIREVALAWLNMPSECPSMPHKPNSNSSKQVFVSQIGFQTFDL